MVERSEEDIRLIRDQGEQLSKLKGEVAYYKQELIDARSRKAAAEDELNTVKGTVETINNSSKALSTEIEGLNENIKMLNNKLEEEKARADHLDSLVAAMEAQPGVEAQSKVEITDLKTELATSQAELKAKIEEILGIKDKVRLEQEVVQQRDIEISSLNGKLQFLEEELELVKTQTGDSAGLQAEINQLRNKLNHELGELEEARSDNTKLSTELQQQQVITGSIDLYFTALHCTVFYYTVLQVLYNELKKMRGRGDELELLEAAQRDVVEAREAASEYKAAWQQAEVGLKTMQTENRQLFAELETLKSGKSGSIQDPAPHSQEQSEETNANETEAARRSPLLKRTMEAGEAVMANVGTLKLYEILLGLVFISVILSWNPYV